MRKEETELFRRYFLRKTTGVRIFEVCFWTFGAFAVLMVVIGVSHFVWTQRVLKGKKRETIAKVVKEKRRKKNSVIYLYQFEVAGKTYRRKSIRIQEKPGSSQKKKTKTVKVLYLEHDPSKNCLASEVRSARLSFQTSIFTGLSFLLFFFFYLHFKIRQKKRRKLFLDGRFLRAEVEFDEEVIRWTFRVHDTQEYKGHLRVFHKEHLKQIKAYLEIHGIFVLVDLNEPSNHCIFFQ